MIMIYEAVNCTLLKRSVGKGIVVSRLLFLKMPMSGLLETICLI